MVEQGLGRNPAPDSEKAVYLGRYALAAEEIPEQPVPVVLGTSWYRSMFNPDIDENGVGWIKSVSGGIVGGHAYTLKPPTMTDLPGAHRHYDQGATSQCVGFSRSRASSLVDGRLFDGASLYRRAQILDEWSGEEPAYQGTSVNAGCQVAAKEGLWLVRGGRVSKSPGERWKIGRYWWATDVATVVAALHADINLGYVEILNSWGTSAPHITRMTLEVLERLLVDEDGDASIVVNASRVVGVEREAPVRARSITVGEGNTAAPPRMREGEHVDHH